MGKFKKNEKNTYNYLVDSMSFGEHEYLKLNDNIDIELDFNQKFIKMTDANRGIQFILNDLTVQYQNLSQSSILKFESKSLPILLNRNQVTERIEGFEFDIYKNGAVTLLAKNNETIKNIVDALREYKYIATKIEKEKHKGKDEKKGLLGSFGSFVKDKATSVYNMMTQTKEDSNSLKKCMEEYIKTVSPGSASTFSYWENRIHSAVIPKDGHIDTKLLKNLSTSQTDRYLTILFIIKYIVLCRDEETADIEKTISDNYEIFQHPLNSRDNNNRINLLENSKFLYYNFIMNEIQLCNPNRRDIIIQLSMEFFNINMLDHNKIFFEYFMVYLDKIGLTNFDLETLYFKIKDREIFPNLFSNHFQLFHPEESVDFDRRAETFEHLMKLRKPSSKLLDLWFNSIKENMRNYSLKKLIFVGRLSNLINIHLQDISMFYLMIKFPAEFEDVTKEYSSNMLSSLGVNISSLLIADIKQSNITKYLRYFNNGWYYPMFKSIIDKNPIFVEDDILTILGLTEQNDTVKYLQDYVVLKYVNDNVTSYVFYTLMVPSYPFSSDNSNLVKNTAYIRLTGACEGELKFLKQRIDTTPLSTDIYTKYQELCSKYLANGAGTFYPNKPPTLAYILHFNKVLSGEFSRTFSDYNKHLEFIVPDDYPHWVQQVYEFREKRKKLGEYVLSCYNHFKVDQHVQKTMVTIEYKSIIDILNKYYGHKFDNSKLDHLYKEQENKSIKINNLITAIKELNENYGFKIESNKFHNISSIGLTQDTIIERLNNLIFEKKEKNGYSIIDINSAIFIGHFLRQSNNEYFKVVYQYFRSNNRTQSIDDISINTRKYMKDIIDKNSGNHNDEVLQKLAGLHGKAPIAEIESIIKFIYPDLKSQDYNVKSILEHIIRVTSVFGIQKNIGIIYNFIKSNSYIKISNFDDDRIEIDRTIQLFKDEHEISNKERDMFTKTVTYYLGGLNYHQFEIFDLVKPELIEFYSKYKRREDFEAKNRIITDNLVNDQFNSGLLTNTITVYNYLEPFIACSVSQVTYDIKSFCMKVAKSIPSDVVGFENCINKIKFVSQNFPNILALYSTSGGVYGIQTNLPTIVNLLDSSIFRSFTTKNLESLPGWSLEDCASKQIYSQEKIEDFDQGIKFIRKDHDDEDKDDGDGDAVEVDQSKISPENQEKMDYFISMVTLLKSIHQLHGELDQLFHHKYFKGYLEVDISKRQLSVLKELEFILKEDIKEWKDAIVNLPQQLWLLRSHGLSSLIHEYTQYVKNTGTQNMKTNELASILNPYLRYAFPTLTKTHLVSIFNAHSLLLDKLNYQDFFKILIELMKEANIPNVFSSLDSEEKEPFLVTGAKESEVMNVIFQLNNSMIPHPSQLFYGSTFDIDSQYFFNIAEKVEGSIIFLISIPNDKYSLKNWLSGHYSQQTRHTLNRVYIISTDEKDGHDLFYSPLTTTYTDSLDYNLWPTIKERWKSGQKGVSLKLVCGETGSGKSHFIESEKKKYHNSKTILIRPGFNPETLISTFKSILPNSSIMIHFDISPYTDFESFNRFIYPLVTHSFIIGNKVGHVLHIDNSISLNIYIELGSPLKDSGYNDINEYISSITFISKLSEKVNHLNAPWILTGAETICLSVSKQHDLQTYLNDHVKTVVKSLERNYNADFLTNQQITNFLFAMKERLEFLVIYNNTYQYMRQFGIVNNVLDPNQLYNQFVLESFKLCDPVYSSNKSIQKSPPMITCRSVVLDNDPEPGAPNQMAHIEYVDFSNSTILRNIEGVITPTTPVPNFSRTICSSFNITSRTGILLSLCQQYSFVLTQDFGFRLLILHNKVKNQRSLILTGDTGVGKTYILIFYSLLVNASHDVIPDIIFEIKEIINQIITNNVISTITKLSGDVKINDIIETLNKLDAFENGKTEQLKQAFRENLYSSLDRIIKKLIKSYTLIDISDSNSVVYKLKHGIDIIDNKEKMIKAVNEIIHVKFKSLFHRIIMHQRYTSKEFKIEVNKIIQEATKLLEINPNIKMVVFVDEFNTAPSDTLALINDIFVNGRFDGQSSIPKNIFWVGAMNPKKLSHSSAIDHTGQSTSTTCLDFIVNHPPPSMDKLFLKYGKFKPCHELPFLDSYFNLKSDICKHSDELKEFIVQGQDALREAKEVRVHMSIRDIIRTIDLYKFFMGDIGKSIIRCAYTIVDKEYYHHWYSMITSMALSYYLRVSQEKRDKILDKFNKFIKSKKVNLDHCNDNNDNNSNNNDFHLIFKSIYNSFCKNHTRLPVGIALTESLQLNIFTNVVGINCNIPICIVGPPGCSKTLSFSIVVDNMNDNKMGVDSPWALMPRVDSFRYQCTPLTSDLEIKQKFEQAIGRQRDYDSCRNPTRCVVFIDEAGLVNEEQSPMKVMHDYLDKVDQKTHKQATDISIVILSNKILDAAKTSRTMQLIHSRITQEDEIALVQGCLFNNKHTEQDNYIINGLCESYRRVNDFTGDTKHNLFHQRDFVYFLRHLQTLKGNNELTAEMLLISLERNFNGIHLNKFKSMATLFFTKLGFNQPEYLKLLEQDNTIQRIKESLDDKFDLKVNPNTTAFRYMLLLDPTENETSIMILKEMGIEHTVIRVGGFENDNNPESLVKVVSQIKNHMSIGKTVVLVNSQSIDACFYEVFNKYFTMMSEDDKHFLASVSYGNHSIYTPVHPDFKIIIHVPMSRLDQTQLPWLNRFEKYRLSIDNIMNHYLQNSNLKLEADQLRENANHFVNRFHIGSHHQKTLLAGFSETETIPSIIFSMIKESLNEKKPLSIDPFRIIIDNLSINEKFIQSKESQAIFKRFNWKLLQIARPETVYNSNLPRSYVEEYLLRQDHFNTLRFLQSLIQRKFDNQEVNISNKWIIYTRTSPTLHTLNDDRKQFKRLLLKHTKSLNSESIKLIQLNKIKSTEECSKQFNFINKQQQQQICLVIADMSVINQHQINYVISMFNKTNTTKKLLITICHYPPEVSISGQFKLNSIFLNGLDYFYIDSIGLKLESSVTEDPNNHIDSDYRTWVAKSYGLRPVNVNDKSLTHTFRDMFYKHLGEVARTSRDILSSNFKYQSKQERDFYTDSNNRATMIEEIFNRHPTWFQLIIKTFEEKWGKKNQFNIIISDISNLILTGKLPGISILDAIKNSLSSYIYPVVSSIFNILVNRLQISNINSIKENTNEDTLIKLVLQIIDIPTNTNIEERFEQVALVLPECNIGSSKLPLFEHINESIIKIMDHILKNFEGRKNIDIEKVILAVTSYLNNHPMKSIIDHINENQFEQFVYDFMTRVLLYKPDWISFIIGIFKSVSKFKLTSVIHYPIVFHLEKDYIKFIKHLITPLFNLDSNILERFEEQEFHNDDLLKIKTNLARISVDFLLDFIINHATSHEDLIKWCSVTREIFNRIDIDNFIFILNDQSEKVMQLYSIYQLLIYASVNIKDTDEKSLILVYHMIKFDVEKWQTNDIFKLKSQFDILSKKMIDSNIQELPINCLMDIMEPGAINILSNISNLLHMCNSHQSNVPFGWYSNILCHLLKQSSSERKVIRQLKDFKLVFNFNPIINQLFSSGSESILNYLNIGEEQLNQAKFNSQLCNVIFYVLYEINKQTVSKLNDLDLLRFRTSISVSDIYSKIKSDVYDTFLLEKFAELINTSKNTSNVCEYLKSNVPYLKQIYSLLNCKVQVQDEIMKSRINQVYLLNKIESEQELLNLMKSPELLSLIGMDDRLIEGDISIHQMNLMPFMVDRSSEDGKLFLSISQSIESQSSKDLEDIISKRNNEKDKGFIRMSLFLITYQMFAENKPTGFLATLLVPNSTIVVNLGLTLFLPLFDKIFKKTFKANVGFDKIISNTNKTQDSATLAQMMVNFIAVSIGCSNKCYLFNIYRDPLKVTAKSFPANEGAFKDCGMIYRYGNPTDPVTHSMSGNILNKFLISSTSWGAFSWTVNTCNQTTLTQIMGSGFVILDGVNNQRETLTDYVNNRSLISISEVCRNNEMKDRHIEPSHFMSELIYLIWSDSYEASSPALNSVQLNIYEQHLTNLIRRTFSNYQQYKSRRTEIAEKQSQQLKTIQSIRNSYTNVFTSPFYDIEYLINLITIQQDIELLKLFTSNSETIGISKYFPDFIKFLNYLYNYFNYRLPPDYRNRSIIECIDYLNDNSLESEDTISSIQYVWSEFKSSWEKVTEQIKTLETDCHRTPEYEKIIQKITDDTLLINIIPSETELIDKGIIINLINNWMVMTQGKAILLKERVKSNSMFDLIVDVNIDDKDVDLETIPFEFGSNYLLLGSNFEIWTFSHFIQRTISQYQRFNRNDFKPDFNAIQNKLICNFLSGKVIGTQLKSYQKGFNFTHKQVLENNEKKEHFTTVTVRDLMTVMKHIPEQFKCEPKSFISVPFQNICKKKLDHSHFESLCQYLIHTISNIINNKGSLASLNDINIYDHTVKNGIIMNGTSDIHPSISEKLKQIDISYLYEISDIITKSYLAREYLYNNVMQEPEQYDKTFYENLRKQLIEEKSTESWINFIKDFVNRLTSHECKAEVKKLQPNYLFQLIIDKYTKDLVIPIGNIKNHSDFIATNTTLNHYSVLLRTLHEVLSTFYIRSQEHKNTKEYSELYGESDELDENQFEPIYEDVQMDQIDEDDFNIIDNDFIRAIEPLKNNKFIHCLFNWIRFKPQTIDIKQEYTQLFNQFLQDCDKKSKSYIDISNLFDIISPNIDSTTIHAKQPGLLLMEILNQIEKHPQSNLFNSILTFKCSQCNLEKDESHKLHFTCKSNVSSDIDELTSLAVKNFISYRNNYCEICENKMEVTLKDVPQYIFLDIDRNTIKDTYIEPSQSLYLCDYFTSKLYCTYEIQSILYNKDKNPNIFFNDNYYNCSETIEILDDEFYNDDDIFNNCTLHIYKLTNRKNTSIE